jgi:hypothetical protein
VIESVSAELAAAAGAAIDAASGPGGSDLFAACRAVGESLGIAVRAPRPSADPASSSADDDLAAMARASGFHTRPVTLREGWWRRGGEPLLGVATHPEGGRTPVALIPAARRRPWSAHSYELRMPDGRRCPVDRRVAGSIDPGAWVFYRPLPDRSLGIGDLFGWAWS